MNANAKKWVVALRSGEYKQVKNVLCELDEEHNLVGHCCLGVACELYQEDRGVLCNNAVNIRIEQGDNIICNTFEEEYQVLPSCVTEWLGIEEDSGAFRDENKIPYCLAHLNDAGKTFDQIADVIESEPDGLFSD